MPVLQTATTDLDKPSEDAGGRENDRAERVLAALGVVLAARAVVRLALLLAIVVTRMTVLRPVMALPDPAWTTPRVLGIDEFATRKGRRYSTILVDCETHQPLGLLPDRDAVVHGMSTDRSSGPVEGRVNDLKALKRSLFGRAKPPPIRNRLLLTAACRTRSRRGSTRIRRAVRCRAPIGSRPPRGVLTAARDVRIRWPHAAAGQCRARAAARR
ncbi:hypothetical protein [Streptomyces sp. NPDC056660]|uniref:hypothetical protein n=1 Tax=Streptomyces sp. NPDC056660 TaxID=3345897 RepID=UPI003690FD4E